jgi:hypothetical protein
MSYQGMPFGQQVIETLKIKISHVNPDVTGECRPPLAHSKI